VVTGIGHEVDFTIADFVADARAPTPTAAAELLSPHREDWLAQFATLEAALVRRLRARLQQAGQRLDWLAARLVHPRRRIELLGTRLHALAHRLTLAQQARRDAARARLATLGAELRQPSPRPRLRQAALAASHLRERLVGAARRGLDQRRERLRQVGATLNALSPLATLARGYAIVLHGERIVRDAATIAPGERVRARLARGGLDCLVEKTHEG
jgi:exodeoxyribonuclease VII large subunit